jgi:Na+-transporting NADH:ubiquinone oxidoreductase subunit C
MEAARVAKSKKKKKQVLYPTLAMIALTAILTLSLALLNDFTKERISKLEMLKVQKTILYVLGIDVDTTNDQAVVSTYEHYIQPKSVGGLKGFEAVVDGTLIGYVFPMEGAALWGSVKGYIAVSPEFDKILGVDFVSHSETPGLGGRIDESWYKEQFRGLPIPQDAERVVIYRPAQGGNADAITGATLTSDAIRKLIDRSVQGILQAEKGGV